MFNIIFDQEFSSYKQVVYKIFFDDKIYVGCTNCFRRRMLTHQSVINSFPTPEQLPPKLYYYFHIISYINEYNIREAKAEIQEEVNGSRQTLLEREGYWIRELYRDYRLLNFSELQLFSEREIATIEDEMKRGIFRLIPPRI